MREQSGKGTEITEPKEASKSRGGAMKSAKLQKGIG